MKNSKVVSFLSPFKVGQARNLWTLPRMSKEVHLICVGCNFFLAASLPSLLHSVVLDTLRKQADANIQQPGRRRTSQQYK